MHVVLGRQEPSLRGSQLRALQLGSREACVSQGRAWLANPSVWVSFIPCGFGVHIALLAPGQVLCVFLWLLVWARGGGEDLVPQRSGF